MFPLAWGCESQREAAWMKRRVGKGGEREREERVRGSGWEVEGERGREGEKKKVCLPPPLLPRITPSPPFLSPRFPSFPLFSSSSAYLTNRFLEILSLRKASRRLIASTFGCSYGFKACFAVVKWLTLSISALSW
ncbi:MAG: hypothetical protein ACKESB_02675 [Candidatus Hodgkinia cicadicola]